MCLPPRRRGWSGRFASARASAGSPASRVSASAAVVSHICRILSRGYYPLIGCLSRTLLCLAPLCVTKEKRQVDQFVSFRSNTSALEVSHISCEMSSDCDTNFQTHRCRTPALLCAFPQKGRKKTSGSVPPGFHPAEKTCSSRESHVNVVSKARPHS